MRLLGITTWRGAAAAPPAHMLPAAATSPLGDPLPSLSQRLSDVSVLVAPVYPRSIICLFAVCPSRPAWDAHKEAKTHYCRSL